MNARRDLLRTALLFTLVTACTGSPVVGGYIPSDASDDITPSDIPVASDTPVAIDTPGDVSQDVPSDASDAGDIGADVDAAMGCTSDAMCVGSASGAVCDATTGRCVECLAARDTCPADRHCDPGTNRCLAGCRSDEGCAMASGDAGTGVTLRCDTSTRACVACLVDDHCPAGTQCVGQRCVAGCSATRACPTGETCCGGACIDTRANIAHCGACDRACALDHAAPTCAGGSCAVASCVAPFADCNGAATDGCEVDTTSSLAHCGRCGSPCVAPPHASATCAAGACGFRCDDGFADCDGVASNGCEAALATSTSHCGRCGNACNATGGTASCASGVCAITCASGRGDCDGNATNGCEVDTNTTTASCGACGRACSLSNATASCAMGACAIASCSAGFADCDGNATNGCEVDTRVTTAHCGGCGVACSLDGASTTRCDASRCVPACSAGRGDCDSNPTNGCETTTSTSTTHCGACGRACSAGDRCVDGVCTPPLPTSCAVLLRRAPSTPSGEYTLAPIVGTTLTAWCDMSTGRGYTFLVGRAAGAIASDILSACPTGTTPFEVRSEAHADALRREVRRRSSTGAWYWANHFTGPTSTCPTVAARTGWLRGAADWVDANIRAAFLAPLDIHENCNLDGVYDPVPVNDRDGFTNRDCTGCTVLYNARERTLTGTVVCSVNDVPACAAGYDDCDRLASNGCEVRTATDASNCGQCGRACAAGLSCSAGVCVTLTPGTVITPPPPPIPTGAPVVMASGIRGPQGLVVARDGTVYVSALVAGAIVRIDPATTPGIVTTWATGFSEPAQLTFDASGNLLVAERSANRLTRVAFNADGTAGARTTVASGFSGPWGVTLEADGSALVSNEFGNTVDRVSPAGVVTRGVISGYNAPLDMRFDPSGRLLVGQYFGTALNNGTLVHRYDTGLRLERSSMGFSGPIGIALDATGGAYVANWDGGTTGAGRIVRLASDGVVTMFYRGLNGPHGIAFDARGGLWLADYVTDRVLRLGGL